MSNDEYEHEIGNTALAILCIALARMERIGNECSVEVIAVYPDPVGDWERGLLCPIVFSATFSNELYVEAKCQLGFVEKRLKHGHLEVLLPDDEGARDHIRMRFGALIDENGKMDVWPLES